MGINLHCKKPGCDHTWTYTGAKTYPAWVTCPNCLNKVRLPNTTEEDA